MDLNQLRRGVDLMAGAVRKASRPAPAPMWGEWATVVNTTTPTVILDSDWEQTARPVQSNAAGPLMVGQRVWVAHQGAAVVIVANRLGGDTGWSSLPLLGSWTAAAGFLPQARRTGRTAEIRGMVTIPTGAESTDIATIPSDMRPDVSRWIQPGIASTNKAVCGVLIDVTSGAVRLSSGYWTTTPTGQISITGSWLIG